MRKTNIQIRNEIKENAGLLALFRRSDIAHHFKGCMTRKGIKVADVAERLDVSPANISRMLNGEQNLTLDKMHALADALQEKLVLALESNWRDDSLLDIDADSLWKDQKWHRASLEKIGLSSYDNFPDAANDSDSDKKPWAGFLESGFKEQFA